MFGDRMVVEPTPTGWRLWVRGSDGKRAPANAVIPSFVTEDELAQYLDDLYHESASPQHPAVRRIVER